MGAAHHHITEVMLGHVNAKDPLCGVISYARTAMVIVGLAAAAARGGGSSAALRERAADLERRRRGCHGRRRLIEWKYIIYIGSSRITGSCMYDEYMLYVCMHSFLKVCIGMM